MAWAARMGMITAMRTELPSDEASAVLAQWFSPAFPIGSFAYSHGLEAAIDAGQIKNGGDLHAWLSEVLRFGAGQVDAIFIQLAAQSNDVKTLNQTARAYAPSKERLLEMDAQGAAFAGLLRDVWQIKIEDAAFAIVIGQGARALNLPVELTIRHALISFTANLIAAAQRLAPIGQSEGQKIHLSLAPIIAQIAKSAIGKTTRDISSTALMSDMYSMRHETQYSRIFRS